MGLFDRLLGSGKKMLASYVNDKPFLAGVCAAAANVIVADGKIEDSEIEAALKGMSGHAALKDSFPGSEIEAALTLAINHAKTRMGKIENQRAIEALAGRNSHTREDVFLIAADVADDGGIGPEEKIVLLAIGKLLDVNAMQLLG